MYGMESDKQSWLWCLQMAHISQQYQSPKNKRLVVTDNFYTRPSMSRTVKKMTDGEIRTIGTCRLSFTGIPNRRNLEKGIAILRKMEQGRGSWLLVADYKLHPNHHQMKKKYDSEIRKIPKDQRQPFVPPVGDIVPNSGFIIYMDKQPVVIHTNDLKSKMTNTFMYSTDELAVELVHGLVPLKRWTKKRNMFREEFMAPAIFVAYNIFMNGVDRMDQIRAVNPSRRKEQSIGTTMLTWTLDIACHNSFSVYKSITSDADVSMKTFKHKIAVSLVGGEKKLQEINNTQTRAKKHLLFKNKDGDRFHCFLRYSVFKIRNKTPFSCIRCQRAFHVDCFTSYHNKEIMKDNKRVYECVQQAQKNALKNPIQKRRKTMLTVADIKLPCDIKK